MATQTSTPPDVRVIEEPWKGPKPAIDHDNEDFWDGLREHRLLVYRCKTCGALYWPKSYCQHHANEPYLANIETVEASGRGKIFAFNIHHWAFNPAFKEKVPYVYALVELAEGPLVSTMLVDVDPSAVQVGMPVEIVYEDYAADGFTLPKFKPATASA